MAGQRSYYSNIMTPARGLVVVPLRVQINGAAGTSGTRILTGRGCALASVSATASGTNNAITITFPEKYGTCVLLEAQPVSAGTSGVIARVSTDYSATTGQATFDLGTVSGATFTGSTSPNVTVYIMALFELGA